MQPESIQFEVWVLQFVTNAGNVILQSGIGYQGVLPIAAIGDVHTQAALPRQEHPQAGKMGSTTQWESP